MLRSRFLAFLLALALVPALAAQQPVDRSQRPQVGPPPALELPPIQRFTLSNGLPVLLMEKSEVPVAEFRLVVRAGSVDDPQKRYGLADLTADLLDEGAGDYTALELADAVEFLGARLTTSAGYHSSEIRLSTPTSKLDDALPLMADVALRPAFADGELERLRGLRLTAFTQQRDEARALASLLYDKTLYGPAHPYGRATGGDSTSTAALSTADVQAFYRTYYTPANSALVVVGAVTRADLAARLERLFGAWTGTAPAATEVAEGAQVERTAIYLVDKPGAAQTVVRVGRIGAARSSDDTYALDVLNTLLGGSFTSRLNQNLRERNGYTYGASSGFAFRPVAGPFTASADVQTAVTGPALAEFFNELRAIGTPVPDDELTRAKNYRALTFPRAFATVGGTAGMLADLWLNDLPDAYLTDYIQRVLAVTQADVARVAREYVDPGKMAVVLVGDRAQIEDDVRALDLGTVTLLTVEDVLRPQR